MLFSRYGLFLRCFGPPLFYLVYNVVDISNRWCKVQTFTYAVGVKHGQSEFKVIAVPNSLSQIRSLFLLMAQEPTHSFKPNFSSTYSIVLNHPIEEVFSVIGTSEGAERVTRLSGLCSSFELVERDAVPIPDDTPLSQVHLRTVSGLIPTDAPSNTPERPPRTLPRQHFTLVETVPMLFGLIKKDVHLTGTLTWDYDAKLALYESCSDSGIFVWKLRTFEEAEGGKTRVTEKIEGVCPGWLRAIVQQATTKSHRSVSFQSLLRYPHFNIIPELISTRTTLYFDVNDAILLHICAWRSKPRNFSWCSMHLDYNNISVGLNEVG